MTLFVFSTTTNAQNTWQPNGNNIYYNAGNVGVGVVNPVHKLHLNSTTPDGTTSISGISLQRYTNTTSNVTSYDKGVQSFILYYDIPVGVTDNGYKIGVDASSFASRETGFAGTLRTNMGVWARAGIYNSAPSAVVTNAYGLQAEVLARTGTITNGYGVYI